MLSAKHFNQATKQHQKHLEDMIKELGSIKHNAQSFNIDSKMDTEIIRKKIKNCELKSVIGIYGIFVKPKDVESIKRGLIKFRDGRGKDKRQAVPKPNATASARDGCLYIGMCSKSSLEDRLLQHFISDCGHATRALKISLWKDYFGHTIFQVYYYTFEKSQSKLVRELEKAIWNFYEPAIGKL